MYYVSFNDKSSDPTYESADYVSLIESDNTGENPCVGSAVRKQVPVMPNNREEVIAFCDLMGWEIKYDDQDRMIVYPGV